MNLEELEKQVTLMEDIQEIETLQRRYAYYFDSHQWQNIVDLFSDSTEYVELESVGRFLGKEGVKRLYYDHVGRKGEPTPPWILYLILQIGGVVDVDPDGKTAYGRWQTLLPEVMPYAGILRQQWLHGYYENKYVKEGGRWMFSRLDWNVTFYTTYENGWLIQPLLGSLWNPEAKADAHSINFYPYPSGYHFPYHYKHPITGKPR